MGNWIPLEDALKDVGFESETDIATDTLVHDRCVFVYDTDSPCGLAFKSEELQEETLFNANVQGLYSNASHRGESYCPAHLAHQYLVLRGQVKHGLGSVTKAAFSRLLQRTFAIGFAGYQLGIDVRQQLFGPSGPSFVDYSADDFIIALNYFEHRGIPSLMYPSANPVSGWINWAAGVTAGLALTPVLFVAGVLPFPPEKPLQVKPLEVIGYTKTGFVFGYRPGT